MLLPVIIVAFVITQNSMHVTADMVLELFSSTNKKIQG